jgi:hypothetical protein
MPPIGAKRSRRPSRSSDLGAVRVPTFTVWCCGSGSTWIGAGQNLSETRKRLNGAVLVRGRVPPLDDAGGLVLSELLATRN